MYGRWTAVRQAWPLVLIISAIHGIGQVIVVAYESVLAAFIPAAVAMLALYPLSRWRRHAEPLVGVDERPAMRADRIRDVSDTRWTAPELPFGGMGIREFVNKKVVRVVSIEDPA